MLLSIFTFSKNEKILIFSLIFIFSKNEKFLFLFSKISILISIFKRNIQNRSFFNEKNILFKNQKRNRKFNIQKELFKFNVRRKIYYIVLNKIFTNDLQTFYDFFIILFTKNKKFHRDNLSSKSKYYNQMFKHSKIKKFLKIIKIEISTLILKKT